jgi:hypothetical protein
MNRAMRIATALAIVGFFLGGWERKPETPAIARKLAGRNLLLITLDTTRADRLGCYGYKPAETPTLDSLPPPKSHYTHRVIHTAVRLVVEDGLPYRSASWHLWRDHRVFVPFATVQNLVLERSEGRVEAEGKKSRRTRRRRVF